MIPIEPSGTGRLIYIGRNQPQYEELIARIYPEGAIQTLWRLSDEERKAISDGGNLNLVIYTFGGLFPPVHLGVDSLEELDFT